MDIELPKHCSICQKPVTTFPMVISVDKLLENGDSYPRRACKIFVCESCTLLLDVSDIEHAMVVEMHRKEKLNERSISPTGARA